MIVQLIENENGDLVLPFDEELLDQLGWHEGDTLLWEVLNDGCVSITKRSEQNENS